jgi:hypothetical protein
MRSIVRAARGENVTTGLVGALTRERRKSGSVVRMVRTLPDEPAE